jgi:nicotinamidase/pyrazinamidase
MKALLIVDVQNDFLPGGALQVKGGDRILPVLKRLMKEGNFDFIVACQDCHPKNHSSFAVVHGKKPGDHILLDGLQQILWPSHCVQGTDGAKFSNQIDVSRIDRVFFKGADPKVDSYSAFFDNARRHQTGLKDFLESKGVKDLYMAGLATDYCVKYSAMDALSLGLNVFVVVDGCKGVDLMPGDTERAIKEIERAGAKVITSSQLLDNPKADRGGGI